MSVTLEERKVFYDELISTPSGYRDELKDKMAAYSISESKFNELFRESGSVGFTKDGLDGLLKKRYKVTELGKEQINSFLLIYDL